MSGKVEDKTRWWQSAWPAAHAFSWSITLGLLLVVAGARLWLIWHYGSDQPFHDQWVAEGMYFNWFDGNLDWRVFFYPHNEHRPALTRLLAMAEFWLNGQWDCRVQVVANLAIYLSVVATLTEFARRLLPPKAFVVCAIAGALLFSQPASFENALWGFQSQFYFLLLLGTVHVLGSCRERMDTPWLLAQLAGLLGLFTLAAGVVSAVTVFLFSIVDLLRGRRNARTAVTFIVSVALMIVAWAVFPGASVPHDDRAATVPQFLAAFLHLLAWPVSSLAGCWLALPWVAFAVRCVIKPQITPVERRLLALGVWCGLLMAAFAYGRGSKPGVIAVRYYDVFIVGLFVNSMALAWWGSRAVKVRWGFMAAALAWAALLGAGYWRLNRPAEIGRILGEWRDYFVRQQTVIRDFLVTDDERVLSRDVQVRSFLPHFEFTRNALRDPRLRRRLPPSLVPPLALVRDADRSGDQMFVSMPIERVGLCVLRFRVQGALGDHGSLLQLERLDGTLIEPLGQTAGDARRLRTVNFRPGDGPVRVIARAAAGSDFSFLPPIEVGLLSWLVPKLLASWAVVGVAGGICFSLGALAVVTGRAGKSD